LKRKNFMPKILNNKGFSVLHILVLTLFIGVVGVFAYNHYSNNQVLQSSTNTPIDMEFGIIETNTDSLISIGFYTPKYVNSSFVSDLIKKLQTKGFYAEIYCDTGSCNTRNQVIYPKNIENTSFGFKVTMNTLGKLRSLKINDDSIDKSKVKVRIIDSWDRWESSGTGIIRKKSRLEIANFVPGPNTDNPTYLQIQIIGEGDAFWNFISNIKSRGVSINDCSSTNSVCQTSKVSISMFQQFNIYSYDFRIPVSKFTRLVSFDISSKDLNNTTWSKFESFGWRVSSDRLSIQNTKFKVIPRVSFSIITQSATIIKLSIKVFNTNTYVDINTALRNGVFYSTSTNNSKINSTPISFGCYSDYCEYVYVLPKTVKLIDSTRSDINIIQIPSGWKLNSSGTGITRN